MRGRRPLRIGVLAEGPTELGQSIRKVVPEDGGKPIKRENEGALHTLIRREIQRVLELAGDADCEFIQNIRHYNQAAFGSRILGTIFCIQIISVSALLPGVLLMT